MKTIAFQLYEERLLQIDSIAKLQRRDRSFVINKALKQYLSLYEHHRDLIEEGIRQDEAGDVIDHEALMAKSAGWAKQKAADQVPNEGFG